MPVCVPVNMRLRVSIFVFACVRMQSIFIAPPPYTIDSIACFPFITQVSLGFAVFVASGGRYNAAAKELEHAYVGGQVTCVRVLPNDQSLDALLTRVQPHVVIFDRFPIEEQYGWKVKQACPSAMRILDTQVSEENVDLTLIGR